MIRDMIYAFALDTIPSRLHYSDPKAEATNHFSLVFVSHQVYNEISSFLCARALFVVEISQRWMSFSMLPQIMAAQARKLEIKIVFPPTASYSILMNCLISNHSKLP